MCHVALVAFWGRESEKEAVLVLHLQPSFKGQLMHKMFATSFSGMPSALPFVLGFVLIPVLGGVPCVGGDHGLLWACCRCFQMSSEWWENPVPTKTKGRQEACGSSVWTCLGKGVCHLGRRHQRTPLKRHSRRCKRTHVGAHVRRHKKEM